MITLLSKVKHIKSLLFIIIILIINEKDRMATNPKILTLIIRSKLERELFVLFIFKIRIE